MTGVSVCIECHISTFSREEGERLICRNVFCSVTYTMDRQETQKYQVQSNTVRNREEIVTAT